MDLIDTDQPAVMAHRCQWNGRAAIALHNLAGAACTVRLRLADEAHQALIDLTGNRLYAPPGEAVELDAYGYRWLREGRDDEAPRPEAAT